MTAPPLETLHRIRAAVRSIAPARIRATDAVAVVRLEPARALRTDLRDRQPRPLRPDTRRPTLDAELPRPATTSTLIEAPTARRAQGSSNGGGRCHTGQRNPP